MGHTFQMWDMQIGAMCEPVLYGLIVNSDQLISNVATTILCGRKGLSKTPTEANVHKELLVCGCFTQNTLVTVNTYSKRLSGVRY